MPSLAPVFGNPFDYNEGPQGPLPVEADPFEQKAGPRLAPVERNPFEEEEVEGPRSLVPVEGNPFEGEPQEPQRATAGEAFLRSVDELQMALYGGAEVAGRVTGLESVEEFGKEGRERNIQEAKQYPAKQEFLKAQNTGDYLQWAKETAAGLIHSVATSVGGALAGGAVAGPPGAPPTLVRS